MSSTCSSTTNKRTATETYDSDLQLLEGMPTKIRRLTFENEGLRQERAKDKLQLAAKDSVIAILIASLKKSNDAPPPAAAFVPIEAAAAVTAPAPVAVEAARVVEPPVAAKPTTANVASSPEPVPAVKAKPTQQRAAVTATPVASAPMTKAPAAAVKLPASKPAAPVVVPKKPVAAPVAAAPPKQLKLQHPAVAVPDDCSEYGEEDSPAQEPTPVAAPLDQLEEEEEEEEEELQVVNVKYHSAKEPKDFFYLASTQKLYRIKYDEDGEQEVGDVVATYDLAAKKIIKLHAAI